MKKIFNSKYYFIVWAVLLALYNVVAFLVTSKETRLLAFWVSYGFVMAGFIVNLLSALLDFPDDDKLNPFTTFSFTFVVVCQLAGIIYVLIPTAPAVDVIIPYAVLTAVYVILMVFSFKTLKQTEVKHTASVQTTTAITGNMHDLIDFFKELKESSQDLAVRNALNDLSHYIMSSSVSDKMNEEVNALEKRIFEYADFIKKNVEKNEIGNIFNNIDNVKRLVKEREFKLRK